MNIWVVLFPNSDSFRRFPSFTISSPFGAKSSFVVLSLVMNCLFRLFCLKISYSSSSYGRFWLKNQKLEESSFESWCFLKFKQVVRIFANKLRPATQVCLFMVFFLFSSLSALKIAKTEKPLEKRLEKKKITQKNVENWNFRQKIREKCCTLARDQFFRSPRRNVAPKRAEPRPAAPLFAVLRLGASSERPASPNEHLKKSNEF